MGAEVLCVPAPLTRPRSPLPDLGGGTARCLGCARCRSGRGWGRGGMWRILPRRLCSGRHGGPPRTLRGQALCFRAAAGDGLLGGPLPGNCLCLLIGHGGIGH